jgi:hypothetical protein
MSDDDWRFNQPGLGVQSGPGVNNLATCTDSRVSADRADHDKDPSKSVLVTNLFPSLKEVMFAAKRRAGSSYLPGF